MGNATAMGVEAGKTYFRRPIFASPPAVGNPFASALQLNTPCLQVDMFEAT